MCAFVLSLFFLSLSVYFRLSVLSISVCSSMLSVCLYFCLTICSTFLLVCVFLYASHFLSIYLYDSVICLFVSVMYVAFCLFAISVCLFCLFAISLCLFLSVCFSFCLFACLSVSFCLSDCECLSLSVNCPNLSICLVVCVCLSVSLSHNQNNTKKQSNPYLLLDHFHVLCLL